MNKRITDIEIFNELSEFIVLHMKSYRKLNHDKGWIEHKTHTDYDLWFIQSGSVKIHIDGFEYMAHTGDVVFFYPGITYMATSPDDGFQFIYVHFDLKIGGQQRILNDFNLTGIIPKKLIQTEALLFVNSLIQSQQLNSIPTNLLYLKACVMAVIAKTIEIYGKGQYIGTFLNASMPWKYKGNLEILRPIFRYVYDKLNKPIKISELAMLACMSEKYFISYFKKALGITPGQYIYQIKMNQARDYLYEQKYTIQEIASFLGYSDPFTFSKAFKKYYNLPPSKFV